MDIKNNENYKHNQIIVEDVINDWPKWIWLWLFVAILSIIIWIWINISYFDSSFISMINDWTFFNITNPSSAWYLKWAYSILLFEIFTIFLSIFYWFFLIYTFFNKYKYFPQFFSIISIF